MVQHVIWRVYSLSYIPCFTLCSIIVIAYRSFNCLLLVLFIMLNIAWFLKYDFEHSGSVGDTPASCSGCLGFEFWLSWLSPSCVASAQLMIRRALSAVPDHLSVIDKVYMMFCWPFIVTYPYSKNQQDALFTFNLFQCLTSTCFEQAYCSSSGGTTLYIKQLVYVMRLCWLAVSRIGMELPILPTSSQYKRMTYTNCCIYRIIPPDKRLQWSSGKRAGL